MTRPRIVCTARMVNGWECRTPSRWWVERSSSSTLSRVEPRCGNHGRNYLVKWPLVTADPAADRDLEREKTR